MNNTVPAVIRQGNILRSSDGEYVYNIYEYSPNLPTMVVMILNDQLETVATKYDYSVDLFQSQIDSGTIVAFGADEIVGDPSSYR
jgi:hypothetical protein